MTASHAESVNLISVAGDEWMDISVKVCQTGITSAAAWRHLVVSDMYSISQLVIFYLLVLSL